MVRLIEQLNRTLNRLYHTLLSSLAGQHGHIDESGLPTQQHQYFT